MKIAIFDGKIENLYHYVEWSGRISYTYSYFTLNGKKVKFRGSPPRAGIPVPIPPQFAEGDRVVIAGEFRPGAMLVPISLFLPEKNLSISKSVFIPFLLCLITAFIVVNLYQTLPYEGKGFHNYINIDGAVFLIGMAFCIWLFSLSMQAAQARIMLQIYLSNAK